MAPAVAPGLEVVGDRDDLETGALCLHADVSTFQAALVPRLHDPSSVLMWVAAIGALLIVMEAMKMEHQIHAPFAGTVGALHTRLGDQVAARQLLVEVSP